MSENIVITNGINKPWELQGTNYDKPEEIVLVNLAVGQLAFLGSAFGKYLSTQATVTAELAEAVNKVRDRSAEVTSLFENWNPEGPKLDLVMPTNGIYPVEPSIVNVNSTNPTVIDKLIIANNLLDSNKIANKFIPPFDLDVDIPSYTYTFGPVPGGQVIAGFSQSIAIYNPNDLSDPPKDLQLYVKSDADGVVDYSRNFIRFQGLEYEITNSKQIWVPRSSAEIDYFNKQLSFVNSAKNSRVLTDTTQLVPVPSEINTSPQDGTETLAQPAVTMEISIAQADFLEFKLSNGDYYYYEKQASQIPPYSADTVASQVGSVVQMADKTYRFVGEPTGVLDNPYPLIMAIPKPCIKNPSNLLKSEILSQYSDKVVRITQRSSEQTTYVNALTQRYNYFYEAATNILKAFTNLWSSLVSNV
jgi:hypothetical protein